MQETDTRWQRFLDYTGLVVIGMTVVLVMLCLVVSLMTMLGKEPYETRHLLTANPGQNDADRVYAPPLVVF